MQTLQQLVTTKCFFSRAAVLPDLPDSDFEFNLAFSAIVPSIKISTHGTVLCRDGFTRSWPTHFRRGKSFGAAAAQCTKALPRGPPQKAPDMQSIMTTQDVKQKSEYRTSVTDP